MRKKTLNHKKPMLKAEDFSKEFLYSEAVRYEKGFNILYEYFDSISDEEKEEVNKRLLEC